MKIQLSDHFTYGRLFRFTLPSIVMMVFTSIYGVVDGFFVSNFAGKTAFASINLIMPFIIIIGSLGFMVGTGGTALVSRILGEGDELCVHRIDAEQQTGDFPKPRHLCCHQPPIPGYHQIALAVFSDGQGLENSHFSNACRQLLQKRGGLSPARLPQMQKVYRQIQHPALRTDPVSHMQFLPKAVLPDDF